MMTARDLVPGDRVLTSRGVLTVDMSQPTGDGIVTVVFTCGHSVTAAADTRVTVPA